MMCLVVDCSEKSVKSGYFGVIIYNWWRKVRKIGIFTYQNAHFTKNLHEDPKYLGFSPQKLTIRVFFMQNTPKLGIFDEIFPKNQEIRIIWYKINNKSNNLGRKL